MSVISTFIKKIFKTHNNETVNWEEKFKASQQENKRLQQEKERLSEELKERVDLVDDALRAEPVENSIIKNFADLIENDFKKELCNIEKGANSAENLSKLERILNEMQLIANCPKLHSKTIGAVGGGFSSGKSSFINSFFTSSEVELAKGVRPVTAIPSYVICDKDSAIQGISDNGGVFTIPTETYKKISHALLKKFKFDLKKIIKYITVLTPMEENYFKYLCLIDTPGYNAPGSGNTAYDFETARKYIKDAEFLIWTVDSDKGTIPKSDINFLDNLEFGKNPNKHLYIVINKAQLKKESDIKKIIDEIEETLDNDFSYAGISAYNSIKKEILASRKSNIYEFLTEHNKPSKKYAELSGMLLYVFKSYENEINRDYNEKDKKSKEVKKLRLQTLKEIDIDNTSNIERDLNKLERDLKPSEDLATRLGRVTVIKDKFAACLDNFCDSMGIDRNKLSEITADLQKSKTNVSSNIKTVTVPTETSVSAKQPVAEIKSTGNYYSDTAPAYVPAYKMKREKRRQIMNWIWGSLCIILIITLIINIIRNLLIS